MKPGRVFMARAGELLTALRRIVRRPHLNIFAKTDSVQRLPNDLRGRGFDLPKQPDRHVGPTPVA